MDNLDLFTAATTAGDLSTYQEIVLPDASMRYFPALFEPADSDHLFDRLLHDIDWQQERITLYGKTMNVPRLSAWYGDAGRDYTYSGITAHAAPWIEPLLLIKSHVEHAVHASFNSVLVNQYRDGKDSVAWHSDDEPELGQNPLIASVSLGAQRPFCLRRKDNHSEQFRLILEHGSCLLMQGRTQHHWQHQIAKTRRLVGARINLTFRQVA